MKKTLLLTVILLLSVTWVVAQNSTTPTPPSGNNAPSDPAGPSDQMGGQDSQGTSGQGSQGAYSQTPPNTDTSGTETQIEGCLSGSSGSYMLTDASGQTWQLQGGNAQLSKNVGKSVRISGTASGAASSGSVGQTFSVSKVQKTSNTCSNAGATPSK